MTKILLTALLGLFTLSVNAQNLRDIDEKLQNGKLGEAKELIDKFLSSEKNAKKADGWYYKAVVYNAISKEEEFRGLAEDPKGEAFAAYKKYVEMDPKMIMGTLNQHVTLFDLFYGYNDNAITAFNAKDFDLSLLNFQRAAEVEDYIITKEFSYNGIVLPKLDTTLILNTAAAAIQAKKADIAATYYAKLADAKVAGEGMADIYTFLVNHYGNAKDIANRDKYMALGKELYPDNPYWCEVQLLDAGEDPVARFAKYEELSKGECGNYLLMYNYAAEMFNYLYTSDEKPADYDARQAELYEIGKRGITINSTPEINLLLARHLYNYSSDLNDKLIAIKGTGAADVQKKKDLKAQIDPLLESMLQYATTTFTALESKGAERTGGDKGSMKVAANLILYYYETKQNKEKIAEWEAKMKAV